MAAAAALAGASGQFGYDRVVRDMPVAWFVAGYVVAGIAYLALPFLIRATLRSRVYVTTALLLMLACGLAARVILFASEPVLEDDYQRYLWDGAVTAHGINPYAAAPEDAQDAEADTPLGRLAAQSGDIIDRIRYSDLRTIYPPVAQGAFALAHWIKPWSLPAWRAIGLALDVASVGLLLVLLREVGRSPLWAALYWWNPIAVKEIANSAHMEAVVLPLVLLALVLAARRRPVAATLSLMLAAGAKLWPALLLPLVLRSLLADPRRLAIAVAAAVLAGVLLAAPILLAGLDETSGFIAYAQKWQTNSALFPALQSFASALLSVAGLASADAGLVVRVALAGLLAGLALWLARAPIADADDLVRRSLLLIGAIVLLSPAQYPWYFLWVLPLLALRPVAGLLILTATLPLYYTIFHFQPRDQMAVFLNGVVWLIWVPAWAVLAAELGLVDRLRARMAAREVT
jgi:alpha-1,6-mannosyltransferase